VRISFAPQHLLRGLRRFVIEGVAVGVYTLIMAGGGGTRLWPASRRQRPKQFLPLLPGGRTLLGATVERLAAIAPPERTLIVTAASQVAEVARAAPSVPAENIVIEPQARNTAACIGLGVVEILRRDADARVAVIPSDQFVSREAPFREALERALDACQGGRVVTVGIRPTGPETGFGYIESGEPIGDAGDALAVRRFVEKPNRETAEGYVTSGRYLWNSGMFFFRAARGLELIARELPELGAILDELRRDPARTDELYPRAPAISIDYGVMERLRTDEIAVVPGDFGWNDVGSWAALDTLAAPPQRDAQGNIGMGETVTHDARNNLIYAGAGRLVAAVGVEGLCIVADGDAVLVLPRDRAQDVREIVKSLELAKRQSYL
jgi:mannose-1-phosphate guanylyltransferase